MDPRATATTKSKAFTLLRGPLSGCPKHDDQRDIGGSDHDENRKRLLQLLNSIGSATATTSKFNSHRLMLHSIVSSQRLRRLTTAMLALPSTTASRSRPAFWRRSSAPSRWLRSDDGAAADETDTRDHSRKTRARACTSGGAVTSMMIAKPQAAMATIEGCGTRHYGPTPRSHPIGKRVQERSTSRSNPKSGTVHSKGFAAYV